MSFFKKLLSSSSVLGVDIGTTSIKVVELKKTGEAPELVNYGLLETVKHFERVNDIIQSDSLKISVKQASSLLKTIIKKSSFNTNDAIASIPSFASYTTLVEMPQMTDSETKSAMSFQIQQNIPLPISQVAVDWMRVGSKTDENGNEKQFILIVAIPNDIIQRYREIFKNAGLSLKALEVDFLSCARSVIGNDKTPSIIMDIGSRSTNVIVSDGGFVKYNNHINYGGDFLTEAIAKGVGVSNTRAEELKRARGLSGGGGQYELSTLQTPFLDVIIDEVIKEKANFQSRFDIQIQRIVLVGGGSELIGIDKYIESKIEIPTVVGNGLLHVSYPPSLEMVSKDLKTRFATSIGSAIKKFTE